MVGIYRIRNGLRLEAVSKSEKSAKKALFNRYCEHPEHYYNDANMWWERAGYRAFVIKEVERWD